MLRQRIFTTSMFVVCAILTLNLTAAFGRDETSRPYRCLAKDAVSILGDGTLNKDVAKAAIKTFDDIVIDPSHGDVTFPSRGTREDWIVEVTALGDYVLFPNSSRRTGKSARANAVTNFIRLRAATKEQQSIFMAMTLDYLVTGTCAQQ
jgi:hypothetical protein